MILRTLLNPTCSCSHFLLTFFILSTSCVLFILPSSPLVMSPLAFLHSVPVLLTQPLLCTFRPVIGPGPPPPPPPPSGYSGVLGGVRRQDGSGLPVRGWWKLPLRLRLCVCACPGGLSRPLSSAVSAVTSSPGPPERGLLWLGANSSLCISNGKKSLEGSTIRKSKSKFHFCFWPLVDIWIDRKNKVI